MSVPTCLRHRGTWFAFRYACRVSAFQLMNGHPHCECCGKPLVARVPTFLRKDGAA